MILPALSKAKQNAYSNQCLNNMWQAGLASKLYLDNNNGIFVPLGLANAVPGWGNWTYGPPVFAIQYSNVLWWPDTYRMGGYLVAKKVYICPFAKGPAVKTIGGCYRAEESLGI